MVFSASNGRALSNSSYSSNKDKRSMITTRDKHDYITVGALLPGDSSIQSAYCSEILGIWGYS